MILGGLIQVSTSFWTLLPIWPCYVGIEGDYC